MELLELLIVQTAKVNIMDAGLVQDSLLDIMQALHAEQAHELAQRDVVMS
jgi:hypothetical protein